jgi:hypothetical protein
MCQERLMRLAADRADRQAFIVMAMLRAFEGSCRDAAVGNTKPISWTCIIDDRLLVTAEYSRNAKE